MSRANTMLRGFGSPVLNSSSFERPARWDELATAKAEAKATSMSIEGTVWATGLMLAAAFVTGSITYGLFQSNPGVGMPVTIGAALLGLLLAFVIVFKKNLAPVLGMPYAIVEGVMLGGVSLMYASYAGSIGAEEAASSVDAAVAAADASIVYQAMALTFGIAGGLLVAYSFRIIRVSNMFIKGVAAVTIGYLGIVLITWLLSMFTPLPSVHGAMFSGGPLGIALAAFVPLLAAANLLVDFRLIEDVSRQGAPKYMNWFMGFGVVVTMVWLYLSILRLLAVLRGSE